MDFVGDRERVGAGCLEDADADRGFVVDLGTQRIFGRAKLDPGDVAQAGDFTILPGLDDDIAEFLLVLQAALRVERHLQCDVRGVRRAADGAGRSLDVLGLNLTGDIARRQTKLGDLLRIEPDAHCVIAGAPDLHLTDAANAGEAVLHIEHAEVAQVGGVVAVVRRQKMHHQRDVRRALHRGDAELACHRRQA